MGGYQVVMEVDTGSLWLWRWRQCIPL